MWVYIHVICEYITTHICIKAIDQRKVEMIGQK